MILSSADILRILGGSEIIRLAAKLSIVDGKPKPTGAERVCVYIDRFPALAEFEATWTIYVEGDDDQDLVIAEIKRLLPKVQITDGLVTKITTTDFCSDNTQKAPEAPKLQTVQVDLTQYEERFQNLVEDVQDRMLLVTSGRPGRDGVDGRDGVNGRDGKDIDATKTELEDLANVETGIPEEDGQVLTLKNGKWTNLFIPERIKFGGGSGQNLQGLSQGAADGDIIVYDQATNSWLVQAADFDANADGGDFGALPNPDGGDLEAGTSTSTLAYPVDGGDIEVGTTEAFGDTAFDGGVLT